MPYNFTPAAWLLVAVILVSQGCAKTYQAMMPYTTNSKGFTVLALSRGAGVPQATWDRFSRIMALLEQARQAGANIQISTDKIGLEGETRLCVDFADPNLGGRLLTQVNELTQGIELITVSNEPCSVNDNNP